MGQETTFTMKEARNRYLVVFALLIFFASLFHLFSVAIILAAALQGCLFRLSKPTFLAYLPAVLLFPILYLLGGLESALILPLLLLGVGILLRMAQLGKAGKNVTVAFMTTAFALAAALAFAAWLWARDALSLEGLRLFFESFRDTVMKLIREWFETNGANAGVAEADIESLLAVTEASLSDVILLLPSILSIFFFAISCCVVGVYKLICRLFRMRDGLSERNFSFSVSVPFAAFYLFLLILSFFISENTAFFILCTNLRVVLTVFIAVVGVSALTRALTGAFPRVSSRFITVLAIVFLCFSSYSVLIWQIVASVTAVRVVIAAFRRT